MARKRKIFFSEDVTDDGAINLTPLIDVVFVVLVMFILIAPMLEIDKVELAKAAAHENKSPAIAQENSPIVIHVHEDDSVWLNQKRIGFDQLPSLLKKLKSQNPKAIPQLYHDKKAHFGTYQTIKNAVETSGFEELDLILMPG